MKNGPRYFWSYPTTEKLKENIVINHIIAWNCFDAINDIILNFPAICNFLLKFYKFSIYKDSISIYLKKLLKIHYLSINKSKSINLYIYLENWMFFDIILIICCYFTTKVVESWYLFYLFYGITLYCYSMSWSNL